MNIFFFGDSICYGQGISIHKGWVPKISQDLENYSKKRNIPLTVINSSINGDTTRQALERMPYDVQSHGIDIILIQFGMNDCNHWKTDKGLPRVSKKAFEANLQEIIDRARLFGAKKILINTNHPALRNNPFPHTTKNYQDLNKEYNAVIRKIAKKSKIILVDIERAFNKRVKRNQDLKKFLLDDGLHLSILGHELYYQIVAPILIKGIEEIT